VSGSGRGQARAITCISSRSVTINALVVNAKRIFQVGPGNCILGQAECADCVQEFIWHYARPVQNDHLTVGQPLTLIGDGFQMPPSVRPAQNGFGLRANPQAFAVTTQTKLLR
jgi:hypothetical protein